MKPAPFAYRCPETVDEAVALLSQHGDDAAVLAGGQSLVPRLSLRLVQPKLIIDVNRLPALDTVAVDADAVVVGALTRAAQIEHDEDVNRALPVLRRALRYVSHPQIRNRSTIGGNIAHADPAFELPAVLVALDGAVRLTSVNETRWVPAGSFFRGSLRTARKSDELVTSISFPRTADLETTVVEMSRRHGDRAIAGVVAGLRHHDSVVDDVRLVLYGVGSTPVRVHDVEGQLHGQTLDRDRIDWAAAEVARLLDPPDDVYASSAYRRHTAAVLTRRALQRLVDGAAT